MRYVVFSTLALALGALYVAGDSSCLAWPSEEHLALVQRQAFSLRSESARWNQLVGNFDAAALRSPKLLDWRLGQKTTPPTLTTPLASENDSGDTDGSDAAE